MCDQSVVPQVEWTLVSVLQGCPKCLRFQGFFDGTAQLAVKHCPYNTTSGKLNFDKPQHAPSLPVRVDLC